MFWMYIAHHTPTMSLSTLHKLATFECVCMQTLYSFQPEVKPREFFFFHQYKPLHFHFINNKLVVHIFLMSIFYVDSSMLSHYGIKNLNPGINKVE